MKTAQPQFYTFVTAAAHLGLSVSQLRYLTRTGQIPVRKMGRKNVIVVSELEAKLATLPLRPAAGKYGADRGH